MKELTIRALSERFQNGATASELMAFFSNAWGRKDIVRESFSPQLSRLKKEGKIVREGKVWKLAPSEKSEAPSADTAVSASMSSGDVAASPDGREGNELGSPSLNLPVPTGPSRGG